MLIVKIFPVFSLGDLSCLTGHQHSNSQGALFTPGIRNVQSLANSLDELTVLARSQYRECSIISFTETRLHQDIPDDNASVESFQTVRTDRDCTASSKRREGGLALLIEKHWCNPAHITVKESTCYPKLELYTLSSAKK